MSRKTFGSIDEARRIARRKLPGAIYHFVDEGKEAELTAAANEAAFRRVLFEAPVCPRQTNPRLETDLLGRPSSMPLVIAPTGFVRIVHPDGELAAARAAAKAGIPISISTWCSRPAGEIVASGADTWFQLYQIRGRDGAAYTMDLAREAGCRVLVVTADLSAFSPNDRMAPRPPETMDLRAALAFTPQAWSRPAWLWSLLRGGLAMRAPNAPRQPDGQLAKLADAAGLLCGTPPSWEDIAWMRQRWQGKMLLKGVMRAVDAQRAADIGLEGVIISNHGGKALDSVPATLSVLPEIAEAAGGRLEIFIDGGVRRGADVVKARALGAKAALVGRPYLWGLAAGGEAGVSQVLSLFRRSMAATVANLDLPSIEDVTAQVLRPLPDPVQWNAIDPMLRRWEQA
jgi:isopentenyl diphosphate isomerase/L-lactate dehydrogenase-like FMN-dependent dehydrogenase